MGIWTCGCVHLSVYRALALQCPVSVYTCSHKFQTIIVYIYCALVRWGGVKERTKTLLMQANSHVFSPTLLHLGSLRFNTPLKPQITIFWQQKRSSWRAISLETEIGTWLPAEGCQIQSQSASVLYIIAILCMLLLCCCRFGFPLIWGEKK